MADEEPWNEESRQNLLDNLRAAILGQLRLAKRDHDDILEFCREVHIEAEAPESEWEEIGQLAVEELQRCATRLTAEKTTWPEETDCDRLDRVQESLREKGILFWQASPCCDTCTGGELPDRVAWVTDRHPDFADNAQGYCFFIDQNLPESLAESMELSVYLAYGWFPPEDVIDSPQEEYERNALAIAHQVCACLRDEGFEPAWDGSIARKIGITLNWQRRTMLE
jgi:hypothetical protein